MKYKLLALSLITLAFQASSLPTHSGSTTPNTSSKTALTPLTAQSPVPLNSYGAVDLNANVPLSAQVIPKPANFTDPTVNSLSMIFAKSVPIPPNLNAKSYILMDANTGAVIAANNPNERLAPASLTKLMLLYITEQELAKNQIHLDDLVTVQPVAWATGGSRMFLKPGDQVAVRDLISGIIVDSGNDAAVTLALHLAGTQDAMVNMMNQQAAQLGMTNTHFSDVMGLPVPNHYSTAYDLALLAKAIITQYPQDIGWYGQKWFVYKGIKQPNFNKLLFIYPYALGLKTGSTSSAGYSLVSAAQIPGRSMELVGVVLNTPSGDDSAADSKALLTYGFNFFTDLKIYSAGQILDNPKVYGGKDQTSPVGPKEDINITIPTNLSSNLTANLKLQPNLQAPLVQNQIVGSIDISLANQTPALPIQSTPAVILKDNPVGNMFRKIHDQVSSWF